MAGDCVPIKFDALFIKARCCGQHAVPFAGRDSFAGRSNASIGGNAVGFGERYQVRLRTDLKKSGGVRRLGCNQPWENSTV